MDDWGYGFNEPKSEREEAENNDRCKNCGELALVGRVEIDPLNSAREIKVDRCLLCGKISSESKSM